MPLIELQEELRAVGASRFTASDYRPGTVTHIVLFRYAAEATDRERNEVATRFRALALTERDGEPYIRSITSGPQLSGEGPPGGYDHAFIVTFASLGDRNFYVGEPVVTDPDCFDAVHADFKRFAGPFLAAVDGALVFDFTP